MNKKDLSEADIKAKFITPALLKAGWNEQTQIERKVYFTDGRIYVKGKITARGKRKFADYILFFKSNIPIAIIEAKDNDREYRFNIFQLSDLQLAEVVTLSSAFYLLQLYKLWPEGASSNWIV